MMGGMSFAFVATAMAPSVAKTGAENARMDFGKHKGELMVHLPDTYLAWISKRRKGRYALWAPLAHEILDERLTSGNNGKPQGPIPIAADVDKLTDVELLVSQSNVSGNGSLLSASEDGFCSPVQKECREEEKTISESREVGNISSLDVHEKEEVESFSPPVQKECREEEKTISECREVGNISSLDVHEKESFSLSSLNLDFLREEIEDSIIFDDVQAKRELEVDKDIKLEVTVNVDVQKPADTEQTTVQAAEKHVEFDIAEKLARKAETEATDISSEHAEEYRWFKREQHPTELSHAEEILNVVQKQQPDARLENLVASFSREEDSNFHYGEFIRWCGDAKAFEDGKYVHEHIMNSNKRHEKYVLNFLVEMYGKWGDSEQARRVFEGIQNKNVFSWNAMLGAYAHSGRARQAMELFQRMDLEGVKPNKLTLFGIIEACTRGLFFTEVRLLHKRMVDFGFGSDSFLITCLINFYGRCGRVHEAMAAFEDAREKDIVTWTTAISALARNRCFDQAVKLYEEMEVGGVKPTTHTLISMLDVCAGKKDVAHGKRIHAAAAGLENDTNFGTSLIHMYGKCADLDAAASVFRQIAVKDVVCWNTVIAAHLENHRPVEALKLFEQIPPGVRPNAATFLSVLAACTLTRAPLGYMRWIHQRVAGCRLENDATVASALVEMYVACGEVCEASRVFQKTWSPKEAAFTAMICGTARAGNAGEALSLLRKMQLDGFVPCYEAFMNVVFVCGQRGMADDGVQQLVTMNVDHGVATMVKDYDALRNLFAQQF